MSASKAFEDAKLLLEYAERHINGLEQNIQRFCQTKAGSIIVEPDVEVAEYTHKFRIAKRANPELKIGVYIAGNMLKDALDHIVAECARLSGSQFIKNAVFPFAGSAERLDDRFERKTMRNLPLEILAFLRALDAYKGGNDSLHALSHIAGRNRHWQLIPTFANFHAVKIHRSDGTHSIVQANEGAVSPEGDLVLFTSPKPEIDYDLSMLVTVGFKGIPALEGHHPVATLRYLAGVVNDVINDCEAICQRLELL